MHNCWVLKRRTIPTQWEVDNAHNNCDLHVYVNINFVFFFFFSEFGYYYSLSRATLRIGCSGGFENKLKALSECLKIQ